MHEKPPQKNSTTHFGQQGLDFPSRVYQSPWIWQIISENDVPWARVGFVYLVRGG
jgi:hypothetical protein